MPLAIQLDFTIGDWQSPSLSSDQVETVDKALQESGKEILVMENLTEEEACQLSDLLDKLRG